jgi:hypothetical protein
MQQYIGQRVKDLHNLRDKVKAFHEDRVFPHETDTGYYLDRAAEYLDAAASKVAQDDREYRAMQEERRGKASEDQGESHVGIPF